MAKRDLFEAMRLEEVSRGLSFEYCLVTAGRSLNRSPSDQKIAAGDILSLDSGGNYKGYIGDLCRMAILGEPDAELEDLLGVIRKIQNAAREQVRPGATGREIFSAAQAIMDRSPHRPYLDFLAHGMGLVSHEAPQLTGAGPVPYPGHYEDAPIEEAMVVSVETGMLHPKRGFIKLEDTVAVTPTGNEGYGDEGRGWTRAGIQAA
jgi:Xaa-Pro aminopeptidase